MKKKKYIGVIIIFFCISIFCISCGKENIEKDSKTETSNDDIKIENNCKKLTTEKAREIAEEIREITTETQKDIYSLDNFFIKFENEKEVEGKLMVDITAESDWTIIRKPEENPIIIGMREAQSSLKTEKEKEKAEVFISGFLAEMQEEYDKKTERIPEYLKIRLDSESESYELLFPEVLNGETTLYSMKEYYDKNYKENRKEKIELGRNTLLEQMGDD